MGADLLMSWIWTTQPEKIDFAKARALLREELAEIPEEPDQAFWARWDPNGDVGGVDGDAVREQLLADTDEIAGQWDGYGSRETFRSTIGPVEVLMSGGMSWGDSPTEMFDTLNRWGNTPAAKAAGFFDLAGRCAECDAPLYGLVRVHHHSENGKDVT